MDEAKQNLKHQLQRVSIVKVRRILIAQKWNLKCLMEDAWEHLSQELTPYTLYAI